MTKLEEIRHRWARMNQWRYNIGRLTAGSKMELDSLIIVKDNLIVYSDRPAPEGIPSDCQCVTAVCGLATDSDTLEDAIAYAEAPTDVAYLLQLLTEASENLEWALDQLDWVGVANVAADKIAAILKGKEVE